MFNKMFAMQFPKYINCRMLEVYWAEMGGMILTPMNISREKMFVSNSICNKCTLSGNYSEIMDYLRCLNVGGDRL